MMKLSQIVKTLKLDTPLQEDSTIVGLNTLRDATQNELSFLENPKYLKELATTKAKAVLIHPNHAHEVPQGTVALQTDKPYVALAHISQYFSKPVMQATGKKPSIDATSVVAPTAYVGFGTVIGKECTIMPGVFIGDNVRIKDNTILYPNSVVYHDCVIGSNCRIHANSVIGSDGFGYAYDGNSYIKIYQNGNVILEDDVEIGSNCSIDRAVFASTIIQKGVKIDNLVQIGHNCIIGAHSVITSQVGISGSTTVGHHAIMGGQAGVAGHLHIAPFSTLYSRTGVTKSITQEHQAWAGFPHMPHKEWLRYNAKLSKLTKN